MPVVIVGGRPGLAEHPCLEPDSVSIVSVLKNDEAYRIERRSVSLGGLACRSRQSDRTYSYQLSC